MNTNNEPRDAFAAQLTNKKPRAKKSWLKVTILIALVIAVGGGVFFTQTKQGRDIWQIAQDAPKVIEVKRNPDLIFDRVNSNIVNILLIGRDVNYKIIFKNGKPINHVYDEDAPARSDTMILLSLDKIRRTMRMVSFPRDALVHMPPNDYNVRVTKLNAAHAYGGPAMLIQALHDDLGITVHRHAVVRFEGFKSVIDQIGGIEVDVIGALQRNGKRGDLNYDDNWGGLHIHLKPGMQLLDGEQAHNYVRFRMDLEGDPGRIRRQQQVMRALGKKLVHQPLWEIPGLVQEVRQQFKTDMTDQELASAAFFANSLGKTARIEPVTLFGIYEHRGSIILNRPKNIKLLSYILGGTFDPSIFLQNSPSTERDELGMQNDSSPEAQELLRAAGILGPIRDDAASKGSTSAAHASPSRQEGAPRRRIQETTDDNTSARPGRKEARIADSSRSENSEDDVVSKPRKRENTQRVRQLSVDSSFSNEKTAVPIRQLETRPSDTSESSPIPIAE